MSDAWVATLAASRHVRVILHANVTQIDTDKSGRVVTGLRFATLERRLFEHLAALHGDRRRRHQIRATDALLQSDSQAWAWQRFGLGGALLHGSSSIRLGADHLDFGARASAALQSDARRRPTTIGSSPARRQTPIWIRHCAERRDATARKGSRLAHMDCASGRAGRKIGRARIREVVLWTTRGRVPADIALRGRKIIADIPNAAAAAIAHLRSVAGQPSRWQFLTIVEPEPNPDSRVLLDSERDPFGLPRVKLDWRLTAGCRANASRDAKIWSSTSCERSASRAYRGTRRPGGQSNIEEPRWVWHHMGTTHISEDPNDGVVDMNCKVHGMHNLYVAGSSVFPTSSTDMPTLTLIALAHRLGAHLRAQLTKSSVAAIASTGPFLPDPQSRRACPHSLEGRRTAGFEARVASVLGFK